MDSSQKDVQLASGVTVTLQAWGLGFIAANSGDYFRVMGYFADAARGLIDTEEASISPIYGPLLERVITLSLLKPEDAPHIRAGDIGTLFEAISELNGLEMTFTKMVGLLKVREPQQAINS